MAFCKNCGTQVSDSEKFCPSCGKPLGDKPIGDSVSGFADKISGLNDTPDYTGNIDQQDILDNKGYAVLAYIGILFLIPLLSRPLSKFARFHTNQGLVLFIFGIAVNVVVTIIQIVPIIGQIIGSVLGLAEFVIMIIGIVNAAQGKAKELPIIGQFKLLK